MGRLSFKKNKSLEHIVYTQNTDIAAKGNSLSGFFFSFLFGKQKKVHR